MLDSWAFSSKFASLAPSTYNSSISNTSSLLEGQIWRSCYYDGRCFTGDIYTETVSVGGIVVNDQIIAVAREINSRFHIGSHGMLGLSFNPHSGGKNWSLIYP